MNEMAPRRSEHSSDDLGSNFQQETQSGTRNQLRAPCLYDVPGKTVIATNYRIVNTSI